METMLVGAMMTMLVMLISGAWRAWGRSSVDAVIRCRLAHEANLAVESLTRDLGGNLPEEVAGGKQLGRLVGRFVGDGSALWLCFDGAPPDGLAGWGLSDTVITYEVQGGQLIRTNQQTGVALAVAEKVSQMQLIDQADSVRIELTLEYRDLTRTYTLIAKDP